MANAVSKRPFSASLQGEGVKLAATSTPGTLIHTTATSSTLIDEIWLWAFNSHTADEILTIEFGGATAPDQNIVLTIPFKQGLVLVVPGLPLLGSGAASLTVKGFTTDTNKVVVYGFCNQITP